MANPTLTNTFINKSNKTEHNSVEHIEIRVNSLNSPQTHCVQLAKFK